MVPRRPRRLVDDLLHHGGEIAGDHARPPEVALRRQLPEDARGRRVALRQVVVRAAPERRVGVPLRVDLHAAVGVLLAAVLRAVLNEVLRAVVLQVERQIRLEHDGAGRHVDLAEAQPHEQRLVRTPQQAWHVDRGAAQVELLARANPGARDARGAGAGGDHLLGHARGLDQPAHHQCVARRGQVVHGELGRRPEGSVKRAPPRTADE